MKLKKRLLSLCLAMLMIFSMLPVYAAGAEGHTHSENCYAKEGDLLCKLPESEGHTHSEECYCPGGELLCGEEENEAHIHNEECYCPGGELLCALEESKGHTHNEDCYAKGGELICGFGNETEPGTEEEGNGPMATENEADDVVVPLDTNPTTIHVGETLLVYVEGKNTVRLAFTPEEDGIYCFYSTGDLDTYGYLFDENGVELKGNDDGGVSFNFKITYRLEANTTYYWGARYYSASKAGNISVTLEKIPTVVPSVEVVTTVPEGVTNAFSQNSIFSVWLDGEFSADGELQITESGTRTIQLDSEIPAGNYELYFVTIDIVSEEEISRNISWPMANGLPVILREDGSLTWQNGRPVRIENNYSITTQPYVSVKTVIPDGMDWDNIKSGSLFVSIINRDDQELEVFAEMQISAAGDMTLTFSDKLRVGDCLLRFITADSNQEVIPNWSFSNTGISLVLQEDGSLTYPDGTAFVLVNTYTPPAQKQDIYVSPVVAYDPNYSVAPDFNNGGYPIKFQLFDYKTEELVQEVEYTVTSSNAETPFTFKDVPVGEYTLYADTSALNLRQGEFIHFESQKITVTENGVYEENYWGDETWTSALSPVMCPLYYDLWAYQLAVTKNVSIFPGSDVPTGPVSFTIVVEGVSGPYADFYDEQEVTFDFTNYQPGDEIYSKTFFFELPAGLWTSEGEVESTIYRVYEKDLPADWYNCLSGGSELITASPIFLPPPSLASEQENDHSSSILYNSLPPVSIRNVYSTEVTLPECERSDTAWPIFVTKRIALADGADAEAYKRELADGVEFGFRISGNTAEGEYINREYYVSFDANSDPSQTFSFGYLPIGTYLLSEVIYYDNWVSSIAGGIPVTVRFDGVTYGSHADSLTVTNTYGGTEAEEDVTFDKLIYGSFTEPQEFVFYLVPTGGGSSEPQTLSWDEDYGAYIERITVQPGTTSTKVTFRGIPAGLYLLYEGAVEGWNSSLTPPEAGFALAAVCVTDGEVIFIKNEIQDGTMIPSTVQPDLSVSNKTDDYEDPEDPDIPDNPSVSFTKQFIATKGSALPTEEQTFTFVLAGYRNRQDGDHSLADTFMRWEQTITYTPGDEQITVSFSDIPAGRYHLIEKNLGEHWTSTLPSQGGISVIVAEDGTVTYEGESSLLVTNTYDNPTFGGLIVSKTVSGSGADTSQDFPFTVTLDDNTITGAYGDMVFTDGVATFTLKDGQSVQAKGILSGVGYTVEETDCGGYTATVNGEAGTIAEGFIVGNEDQIAAFDNYKEAEPSYTSVTVKKVWKLDDGGTAANSVTVTLLKDGKEYDTVVLNAKNNWTHEWSNLDDTYTWSVAEVNVPDGFEASIAHNGNIYTITNDDIPVDPTDPPVDPTDPPVDPTDPPVDPTAPVDPTDPPVDPTDPTDVPTDPTTPTKPNKPDKPTDKVPNTGDNSNIELWISLAAFAVVGLVGTIFLGRKKRYTGRYIG